MAHTTLSPLSFSIHSAIKSVSIYNTYYHRRRLSNFMCASYMICCVVSVRQFVVSVFCLLNENANETSYTQKQKRYNTCTYICQLQHDFWQICFSRWHISENFGSTALPMRIYIAGDNKFVSLFEAPLSKCSAWFVFYNEADDDDDDDDVDIDRGKESTHVGFKRYAIYVWYVRRL